MIQYRALGLLLGVGKVCPIVSLFGETGWTLFDVFIKFNTLKFWHRVISMDSSDTVQSLLILILV